MGNRHTKSDLSRAFGEDGAHKTHVGGQALLEGIMMRGKYNWAVAVREPSGNIYAEEHELTSGKKKNAWMYWPLIRGCRALVESLVLGYKALEISTAHAFADEDISQTSPASGEKIAVFTGEEVSKLVSLSEEKLTAFTDEEAPKVAPILEEKLAPSEEGLLGAVTEGSAISAEVSKNDNEKAPESDEGISFGKKEMIVSMTLGLVLGVVLFIVVPAALTNFLVGEYDGYTFLWNAVDGILRVAIFVFYLWLIGRMQDIKRMFAYHGAEHKTIHCYEHGLPLTPENARSFPRLHVRCGTAFLIMVMIIAILVYTILPLNMLIASWGVPEGIPKLMLVIASRIVFMPLIAGISYEITVKWAGAHPENPLVKIVLWPGMQLQYLTTKEPDEGQLECAIVAMNLVLEREKQPL